MNAIIQKIRQDLRQNSDEATKHSFQRFFKEGVTCYDVKTGVVGKIATSYWNEIQNLEKDVIFELCEELYRSGYCEEAFVVSFWVPKVTDRYEPNDLALFKRWILQYINNWATCDGLCNHTVGNFIERFPDSIQELKHWAISDNRWLKRAAAVSLIIPVKKGKFLDTVFEIVDILLLDSDDMVQKGYGWLLKEASRKHEKEVFEFVVNHRKVMPRTALRYAVELMPKEMRAVAMKNG